MRSLRVQESSARYPAIGCATCQLWPCCGLNERRRYRAVTEYCVSYTHVHMCTCTCMHICIVRA
jgi:hypothetical protein